MVHRLWHVTFWTRAKLPSTCTASWCRSSARTHCALRVFCLVLLCMEEEEEDGERAATWIERDLDTMKRQEHGCSQRMKQIAYAVGNMNMTDKWKRKVTADKRAAMLVTGMYITKTRDHDESGNGREREDSGKSLRSRTRCSRTEEDAVGHLISVKCDRRKRCCYKL